jgi:hypothetical protein
MTLLGAHSNTSQAVKATIEKITTKLKDKFSFLPNIPDFFNQVYFFGKKKISAYIKRKNVV